MHFPLWNHEQHKQWLKATVCHLDVTDVSVDQTSNAVWRPSRLEFPSLCSSSAGSSSLRLQDWGPFPAGVSGDLL